MATKRLTKFLIITFVISGAAWWGLALLTSRHIFPFSHPVSTALHMLGGFGPTIAALFVLEEKPTAKSIFTFIFGYKKRSMPYLFLLCALEIVTIGLSSRELNPALPWYWIPVIFLQATFLYGGEEELGWRGILQPILEKKLNFPLAALLTGTVWGIWHIPLWFVSGSSQQNMPFLFFLALAILLSFWLGAIYKKTKCVFACSVFHGLTNTLLSVFVIRLNVFLLAGLVVMLVCSLYLWYRE